MDQYVRPPGYSSASLFQLLGTIVLILLVSIYGLIALSVGDLLWIWPKFDEQPEAMVVHCYGQDVTIRSNTASFSRITGLINEGLSGTKRWDPLSLSDVTHAEYQTSPQMMTLEVSYEPPVRVHSQYRFFSSVDTLIVPLDGRHAQRHVVFARTRGRTGPGSFPLETAPKIAEYLWQEDVCAKP